MPYFIPETISCLLPWKTARSVAYWKAHCTSSGDLGSKVCSATSIYVLGTPSV